MTERLLDKLSLWGKKQAPNCYGFALSQLNSQQENKFRNPNKVLDDCMFVALIGPAPDVMYINRDLPVIDPENIDSTKVELIAFLDPTEYIGKASIVHVIANRPDADGNVRHRPGYNKPIEIIQLSKIIQDHRIRGHIICGFSRKKK